MKQVGEATIERARVLMSDGAARSCKEVADALGIARTSGSSAMGVLHDRKQVYVVEYDIAPGNSRRIAIYAIRLHNERDVRAPKGVSRRAATLDTERAWLRESRASGKTIFRHPMDAAFFGECAEIKPTQLTRHIIKADMTGEGHSTKRAA